MSLQPEESSGDEKHQRGERSRNEQELWQPTYGDAPVGYTDPGSKSIFHLCSCHLCHYHYEGRVGPRFGLRHTDSITMENKSLSPCQGFPSLKQVKRGSPSRPLDGYAEWQWSISLRWGLFTLICKLSFSLLVDLMIASSCHTGSPAATGMERDARRTMATNSMEALIMILQGSASDDKSDDGIRGPSYANEADTMRSLVRLQRMPRP